MNLSNHFEPMEPRADGLSAVHSRARRRSVKRKLSSGSGFTLLILVGSLGPIAATDYFYGSGASMATEQSTSDGSGATLKPNSGLVGDGRALDVLEWAAPSLLLLAMIIAVLTTVNSVVRHRSPLLRFTRWEWIAYAASALLAVTSVVVHVTRQ